VSRTPANASNGEGSGQLEAPVAAAPRVFAACRQRAGALPLSVSVTHRSGKVWRHSVSPRHGAHAVDVRLCCDLCRSTVCPTVVQTRRARMLFAGAWRLLFIREAPRVCSEVAKQRGEARGAWW